MNMIRGGILVFILIFISIGNSFSFYVVPTSPRRTITRTTCCGANAIPTEIQSNSSKSSVMTNFVPNDMEKLTTSTKHPLNTSQEESLDALLKEALFRMSFFMQTDYLMRTENDALRSLFQTCVDSVDVKKSTIPNAGRGLFARNDIPRGTIVAFYPTDLIGFKFGSGLCNSVQLQDNGNGNVIDVERSSYTIFSLVNRNLCGIDLQKEFDKDGRLFIDMNPCKVLNEGWYCGLINDAATVQCHGDLNYYPKSRSAQNVEIVPFSTAPFQVAVTTKNVKEGEELFVSYGYSYWYHSKTSNESNHNSWKPKPHTIKEQEALAATEMYTIVDETEEKYKEASWVLEYVFNNMNSENPPPKVLQNYDTKNKKKNWIFRTQNRIKSLNGQRQGEKKKNRQR